MAIGPGKYDDLCTEVREKSNADAALTIIVNGNRGSGFSCQVIGSFNNVLILSDMLEHIAKQMKDDHAKNGA